MPPISHHYNPRVYLHQFVNPARKNELWEFDLRTGVAKKSKPKDSGCEDFYHSFIREDGSRDDETIEKSFHALENNLPKLFEDLRNSRPLSERTFAALVTFAALQRARCPMAVQSIQDGMSKIHQYTFELMKHTPKFEKAMLEQGIDPELARKQDFEIKANRDVTLLMLLSVFQDGSLTKLLARMEWAFLQAPPGHYFITSDNPVCCWPPPGRSGIYRNIGPADQDVEMTFPLSRRICAFAAWRRFSSEIYSVATVAQVDAINYRTIVNAWHYVYGPTQEQKILAQVQEFIATTKKREDV